MSDQPSTERPAVLTNTELALALYQVAAHPKESKGTEQATAIVKSHTELKAQLLAATERLRVVEQERDEAREQRQLAIDQRRQTASEKMTQLDEIAALEKRAEAAERTLADLKTWAENELVLLAPPNSVFDRRVKVGLETAYQHVLARLTDAERRTGRP